MIIPRLENYKNYFPSNKSFITNGLKKIESIDSQKPLISVVTIVLNAEKTIEKTINSVLRQSYKNYEYIIVDGGFHYIKKSKFSSFKKIGTILKIRKLNQHFQKMTS
tara:strand:- start:170 stop:490 length:321 start_codon:yes stop_codon:yes gene_type:complete